MPYGAERIIMTATQKRARTMAARYLTAEQIATIARKQNRTTTTPARKASTPAHKATVRKAVVQDRERDEIMAEKAPTMGQMRRINRAYAAQGLREFTTMAEFVKVFPTMLAASIEYRTLKG